MKYKYSNLTFSSYYKLLKELKSFILQKDGRWTVEIDRDSNDITFSKYSPANQDFGFTVDYGEELSDLQSNVYKYWQSFDCSEEAYLWLDDTGHGRNGAPYNMKDVYEDMEACEEYIDNMYDIIQEFYQDVEEID